MPSRAGIAGIVAALLVATPAHAKRPLAQAIELDEDSCFERELLGSEVSRWLGHAELDERISISVRPGAGGNAGSVAFSILRDGQVVVDRRLEHAGAPCSELRRAVALAIAIALDSTLVEARPQPAPAPAAPAPLAPLPAKAAPSRDALLGPFAGAFLGLLPRPTWGAGLELSIPLLRPVDLRLAGFVSGEQSIELGSGRGDLRLAAGRLDGCFVRQPSSVRFRACAGAAFGSLAAQGRDYSEARAPNLLWATAAARLDLRLALGRSVGASLALDGWVPLSRPILDVRASDGGILSERRLPAAGASLSMGADVRIW
jgi:hypothetical protein